MDTQNQKQMPQIIGLTGYRRSGKDTVANVLEDYGYVRVGLADPIKHMLCSLLQETPQEFEKYKEQRVEWLDATRRYMAQTLGTEWGRNLINPAIWLLAFDRSVRANEYVVVPDIRFLNEAAYIRELFPSSTIWRITRAAEYNPKDTARHHTSETEQANIITNTEIFNNGSVQNLYSTVKGLMEDLYGIKQSYK
jgi:dephospho-CoA kinase